MSVSMYTATVPPFRAMLKNLSAVMAKAEAHCEAKKIDPAAFLTSRLYPDMLPFTAQVQIATDNVKGAAGRLAGAEIPKFEDGEKTFPELQARLDKTIAFLDSLTEAQFEGAAERDIVLQLRDRKLEFKGAAVPAAVGQPERLFPHHDRLCPAAPRRRGDRQEGLPQRRRGARRVSRLAGRTRDLAGIPRSNPRIAG